MFQVIDADMQPQIDDSQAADGGNDPAELISAELSSSQQEIPDESESALEASDADTAHTAHVADLHPSSGASGHSPAAEFRAVSTETEQELNSNLIPDSHSAVSTAVVLPPASSEAGLPADSISEGETELVNLASEPTLTVSPPAATESAVFAHESAAHTGSSQASDTPHASAAAPVEHVDSQAQSMPAESAPSSASEGTAVQTDVNQGSDGRVQPELLRQQQEGIGMLSRARNVFSALLHSQLLLTPMQSLAVEQQGNVQHDLQSQSDNSDVELAEHSRQQQQQQSAATSHTDSMHADDPDTTSTAPQVSSGSSASAELSDPAQSEAESHQEHPAMTQPSKFLLLGKRAPLFTAVAATSIAAAVAALLWLLWHSKPNLASDDCQAPISHDLADALQQMNLLPDSDTAVEATPLHTASLAETNRGTGSDVGEGSQVGSGQTGPRTRKPRGKRELSALGIHSSLVGSLNHSLTVMHKRHCREKLSTAECTLLNVHC